MRWVLECGWKSILFRFFWVSRRGEVFRYWSKVWFFPNRRYKSFLCEFIFLRNVWVLGSGFGFLSNRREKSFFCEMSGYWSQVLVSFRTGVRRCFYFLKWFFCAMFGCWSQVLASFQKREKNHFSLNFIFLRNEFWRPEIWIINFSKFIAKSGVHFFLLSSGPTKKSAETHSLNSSPVQNLSTTFSPKPPCHPDSSAFARTFPQKVSLLSGSNYKRRQLPHHAIPPLAERTLRPARDPASTFIPLPNWLPQPSWQCLDRQGHASRNRFKITG